MCDFDFRSPKRDESLSWKIQLQAGILPLKGHYLLMSINDLTREIGSQFEAQSIINSIPGGIVTGEIRGDAFWQTRFNGDYLEKLGYRLHPDGEFLFSRKFSKVYPSDRIIIQQELLKIRDGADFSESTFRVEKKDGSYGWLNLKLHAYLNQAGDREVYGICTDIDQQVRDKLAVQSAYTQLERTITSLPGGVGLFFYADGYAHPVFFSDSLCAIFGMSRDDFIADFHPEEPTGPIRESDAEETLVAFVRSEEREFVSNAVSAQKADGTPIWVRIACSKSEYNGEAVVCVIVNDVTEETELRYRDQWKNEMSRLLEDVTDVDVFDYDPNTDTLCISMRRHNTTRHEYIKQSFLSMLTESVVIHPDDRELCLETLRTCVTSDTEGKIEARLQHRQIGYNWCRVYYKTVVETGGRVLRVVGRIEDIQALKDRERQLLAKAQLEALYRKSTTAAAVLALEFDCTTGARVPSDADVVPSWLPNANLLDMILFLQKQSLNPEAEPILSKIRELRKYIGVLGKLPPSFRGECRARNLANQEMAYRWVQIDCSFAVDAFSTHTHVFLVVSDIDEKKQTEYKNWVADNQDPETEMWTRAAFEKTVSNWILRLRDQYPNYVLGMAVFLCQSPLGSVRDTEGTEKSPLSVAKTIQAVLHEEEASCRLGATEFAVAIVSPTAVRLRERLTLLRGLVSGRSPIEDRGYPFLGYEIRPVNEEINVTDILEKALRTAVQLAYKLPQPEAGGRDEKNPSDRIDTLSAGREPGATPASQDRRQGGKPVFIRTFGHFDVFVEGKAILFTSVKAKEPLAILVDRRGGFVSASEAIAYLWPEESCNEVVLTRFRKVAMRLKATLDDFRCGEILEVLKGSRRVIPEKFDCDYYQILNGEWQGSKNLISRYLSDYSWSEETVASIDLS